jgi:hypothetical protein
VHAPACPRVYTKVNARARTDKDQNLEYGVVASGVDAERNGAAMHHQPVEAKWIAKIVSGSLALNG